MAERWHHVAIEGPSGRILGFVEGFVAARDGGEELFDAEAEGCRVESIGERLHELMTPGIAVHHLVAPGGSLPLVREAVVRAAAVGLRARIVEEQALAAASFNFEFRIFSRERGETIRAWFEKLPPGVETTAEAQLDVRVDPSARGIEAYAPAHDYELRGHGGIFGEVGAVLRLHRMCRGEELVQVSDVKLEKT